MLEDFGLLGIFIVVAVFVSFMFLATPIILRFMGLAAKNKPSKTKNSTYECGMVPAGKAWIQFNFRFYFFAILFVAFDVLTVFLYPWASNLINLPDTGDAMIAVAILISLITVGYIYAWKKGALKWQ